VAVYETEENLAAASIPLNSPCTAARSTSSGGFEYRCDFAYFDSASGLRIDIEVDGRSRTTTLTSSERFQFETSGSSQRRYEGVPCGRLLCNPTKVNAVIAFIRERSASRRTFRGYSGFPLAGSLSTCRIGFCDNFLVATWRLIGAGVMILLLREQFDVISTDASKRLHASSGFLSDVAKDGAFADAKRGCYLCGSQSLVLQFSCPSRLALRRARLAPL
jgi:hypothetical protein